jgi:Cdc6-like AAA superfamily ATPase
MTMPIDPWLPRGFSPIAGLVLQRCVVAESEWQFYDSVTDGRVLVVQASLAKKWISQLLLSPEQVPSFEFGASCFAYIVGGRRYRLEAVDSAESPDDFSECQAFLAAIAGSRKANPQVGHHHAIYLERLSRLLPCYTPAQKTDDAPIAGYWITGGVNVSLTSTRRMRALAPWLSKGQLDSLASALCVPRVEITPEADKEVVASDQKSPIRDAGNGTLLATDFSLPGRPYLESFFNEHVIDLIRNEERYKSLGIEFPGAVLLHGPPGCGKTFAVEKLVEYLDWPCFSIDSSSIGSPYIHETGKKIAEAFEQASKMSPAIVVIDEIDAFLAARDGLASGQHRVEEVAEFLRSIPKAAENRVLVIGMTNRLDSLDPAVVRRGRFDHIIEVDMPTEQEVFSLLSAKIAELPCEADIDIPTLAKNLAGRPLSDLGFIVRESCRLAARAGLSSVSNAHLRAALDASP